MSVHKHIDNNQNNRERERAQPLYDHVFVKAFPSYLHPGNAADVVECRTRGREVVGSIPKQEGRGDLLLLSVLSELALVSVSAPHSMW